MNFIKFAILAVAVTACGGGEKKTETPATNEKPTQTTPVDKTTPTPVAPTATVEPTCENAVAHGMQVMVKAGTVTRALADASETRAVAKCKAENPPRAVLECVLKATTEQQIAACDSTRNNKDHSDGSTTPGGK